MFIEYLCGVVFSLALGAFVIFRSHSQGQVAFGLYLVCLGLNYVPMLYFTVLLANRQNAIDVLGIELENQRVAMSKYRKVSLLLLIPLLPLLFALRRDPRSDQK